MPDSQPANPDTTAQPPALELGQHVVSAGNLYRITEVHFDQHGATFSYLLRDPDGQYFTAEPGIVTAPSADTAQWLDHIDVQFTHIRAGNQPLVELGRQIVDASR